MPLAVLRNGEIRPLEPLPPDWRDGQRLRIEPAEANEEETSEATLEQIDRDFAQLDRDCADSDPADEARLAAALQAARDLSKSQVRRQMGHA